MNKHFTPSNLPNTKKRLILIALDKHSCTNDVVRLASNVHDRDITVGDMVNSLKIGTAGKSINLLKGLDTPWSSSIGGQIAWANHTALIHNIIKPLSLLSVSQYPFGYLDNWKKYIMLYDEDDMSAICAEMQSQCRIAASMYKFKNKESLAKAFFIIMGGETEFQGRVWNNMHNFGATYGKPATTAFGLWQNVGSNCLLYYHHAIRYRVKQGESLQSVLGKPLVYLEDIEIMWYFFHLKNVHETKCKKWFHLINNEPHKYPTSSELAAGVMTELQIVPETNPSYDVPHKIKVWGPRWK